MPATFGTSCARALFLFGAIAVEAIVACSGNTAITPVTPSTASAGITCGPSGMLVPVEVHAGNYMNIAFSAEPATITVNPPTSLTDNHGNATAYALVPYGTQGAVVASTVGATTDDVMVSTVASPVSFSLTSLGPDTSVSATNGEIGSVGQIYAIALHVTPPSVSSPGGCSGSLAGLPVTFSLVQASSTAGSSTASSSSGSTTSSGSSSGASTGSASAGGVTAFTDASGQASAKILVPWGANALLQVSGGAQVQWFAINDNLANPATISCLSWTQQTSENGVYQVTASVTYSANNLTGSLPGFPVTFSIASPIPSATSAGAPAVVAPTSAITSQMGVATAFVTLEQTGGEPTTPPVVVEAVAGSSALTVPITTAASGSFPNPCPSH